MVSGCSRVRDWILSCAFFFPTPASLFREPKFPVLPSSFYFLFLRLSREKKLRFSGAVTLLVIPRSPQSMRSIYKTNHVDSTSDIKSIFFDLSDTIFSFMNTCAVPLCWNAWSDVSTKSKLVFKEISTFRWQIATRTFILILLSMCWKSWGRFRTDFNLTQRKLCKDWERYLQFFLLASSPIIKTEAVCWSYKTIRRHIP
jgi:hypothetical protein